MFGVQRFVTLLNKVHHKPVQKQFIYLLSSDCKKFQVNAKYSLQTKFTTEHVQKFAEISGDTNPIHLDETYAQKTAFKKTVVHGVLPISLVSKTLMTRFPGKNCKVISLKSQFKSPLYIDESFLTEITVSKIDGTKALCDFKCTAGTHDQNKTIVSGSAWIQLMMTSLFEKNWQELTTHITEDISDKWKIILSTMYGESQRYYHTLQHLEEMLQLKDKHSPLLKDCSVLNYAIIFHDAVYDPKAGDNEEKSAALFEDFAKEASLPPEETEKVCAMILATKKHTTPEHSLEKGGSEDLHFLLDFDMAVLGWPTEDYKQYADQIRKEYIHIPELTYCEKRAQVLRTFLQVPYIFATKQFRQSHEDQARKNIQEEIDVLSKRRD